MILSRTGGMISPRIAGTYFDPDKSGYLIILYQPIGNVCPLVNDKTALKH